MEYKEFVDRIIKDLKNKFEEVSTEGIDRLYIENGVTNVSVPIQPMYRECLLYGYKDNLNNYIKIISDILDTYKFKLCLDNVFPLIKPKTYGKEINKNFIRENLFCDLDLFFVSDMGEVFRFVLQEDLENAKIDFYTLKKASLNNINKISNPLIKLDKSLDIYSLRFTTDYGATLWITKNLQTQISNIGKDILFCIPSASSLLCVKYRESILNTYIRILKKLIQMDNDANKISDRIYRRDCDGNYSIIA